MASSTAAPTAPHLASPYNAYTGVVDEPAHGRDREAYDALLRPLFVTSLLIADWLADETYFGADTVLISSASSKTAYGTAYALTRLTEGDRPEVVGLTSPAHVESTRRLGLYDRVLAYDEISTLDPDRPTVYVDLSGSARDPGRRPHPLLRAPPRLRRGPHPLERHRRHGAAPRAGTRLLLRPHRARATGVATRPAEHARRISEAMDGFVATVSDPSSPLMTITWHRGRDAATAAYQDLVAGRTDPGTAAAVVL